MSIKKIITAGLIAGAVSLAAANAAKAEDTAAATDKEKCYGVVKAAMNDCASADKSHSCMSHASADGSGQDWIALPKGVCEKLVNGSLAPLTAEAAPAAAAPAEEPAKEAH